MTLTSADIDNATNAMMHEASQHFRFGLFTRKRERVRALAEWCDSHMSGDTKDAIINGTGMFDSVWVDILGTQARSDALLKEKCGSIFIMILANLLIQLFILWLKRRLDNQ